MKLSLIGYNDNNHAGDQEDQKKYNWYDIFSWQKCDLLRVSKQKIVTLFSCEAKYVAVTTIACHGLWLARLVGELIGKSPETVKILVDNKSTIALSKNPMFHSHSKYMYTWLLECVWKKRRLS